MPAVLIVCMKIVISIKHILKAALDQQNCHPIIRNNSLSRIAPVQSDFIMFIAELWNDCDS